MEIIFNHLSFLSKCILVVYCLSLSEEYFFFLISLFHGTKFSYFFFFYFSDLKTFFYFLCLKPRNYFFVIIGCSCLHFGVTEMHDSVSWNTVTSVAVWPFPLYFFTIYLSIFFFVCIRVTRKIKAFTIHSYSAP